MSFSLNDYIKLAKKEGHSKQYIKEITSYVRRLHSNNLPVIFSASHLAKCLKLPYNRLQAIVRGSYSETIEGETIPELKALKKEEIEISKSFIEIVYDRIQGLLNYLVPDKKNNVLPESKVEEPTPSLFEIFGNASHSSKFYSEKNDYTNHDFFESKHANYNFFRLRKRLGGYREIMAPDPLLKNIQRWILNHILEKIPLDPLCIGFRKRYSIKDNAQIHANQEVILKVDLFRFFDTITRPRVVGMFKEFGYHPNLAIDLAMLTTAEHRESYWLDFSEEERKKLKILYQKKPAILPQGAPTSPAIANIIARKLDFRLSKLSQKLGCKYSRYADDLTFSGTKEELPSMYTIRKIIKDEGFFVNEKKVAYFRKGQKQYVTGLSINDGVRVPRKLKRKIKQTLHFCVKYGVTEHRQKTNSNQQHFQEWLAGNIAFIQSIEPEVGKRFWEKYYQIDWNL